MKANSEFRGILFLVLFAFATLGAWGAEDLSATLQKGLFEEQANRDLNAAIQHYEQILKTADEQRKIVATAIYRLAESYRKQGNQARANELYARLVRDYSDQAEIMKELEGWKQNKNEVLDKAMSAEKPATVVSLPDPAHDLAVAEELQAMHKALLSVEPEKLPLVLSTVRFDQALSVLLANWRSAQTIISREQAKPGSNEIRLAPLQSRVQALKQAIHERAREVLAGIKTEAERNEIEGKNRLQQLAERLQELPAPARLQGLRNQANSLSRLQDERRYRGYDPLLKVIEALEGMGDLDLLDQVALVNAVMKGIQSAWFVKALGELNSLARDYEQEREKLATKALPLSEQEASKAHLSEKREQISNALHGILTGLKISVEAQKAALDVVEERLKWAREESLKVANLPAEQAVAGVAAHEMPNFRALAAENIGDPVRLAVEASELKSLHEFLIRFDERELPFVLESVWPDQSVASALVELNGARQRLAKLQSGYSDNHPEVLKLRSVIGELERQVMEKAKSVVAVVGALATNKQGVAESIYRKQAKELPEELQKQVISEQLISLRSIRNDFFARYRELVSKLETMKGMGDLPVMEQARMAASLFPDRSLDSLLEELRKSQTTYAALVQDYSETHPVLVQKVAEIQMCTQQIEQNLKSTITAMEILAASKKAGLEEAEKRLNALAEEARKVWRRM